MAKAFWEIAKEVGIALGVDIAFKKMTQEGAGHVADHIGLSFVDKRAELMEDLLNMPAEQTDNLWRRHHEATAANTENRFVNLLTKIPKENRLYFLGILNEMSDETFNQTLQLLEHDVIAQFLKRLTSSTHKTAEEWATEITPGVEEFNRELENVKNRVKAWAQRR